MSKRESAWECICGYLGYGKESPMACPQCHQLESFIQLSNGSSEEKEKNTEIDIASDFEDEEEELIEEDKKLKNGKNKTIRKRK